MMSSLMILLLILIMTIGCSNATAARSMRELRKRFSETNERNLLNLERVNYVTFNVTKNQKDPAALQRTRLRQDLQYILSTMVKKIIYKRRFEQPKWRNDGRNVNKIYDGRTGIESKMNIGDFPVENRLDGDEKTSRESDEYRGKNVGRRIGDEIREQTSDDLFRISESLMPIIRRSLNAEMPKVRDYRESPRARINSGNRSVIGRSFRVKRENVKTSENETTSENKTTSKNDAWMKAEFTDHETSMKMHAFIVRDEDIPPCCSPAKEVTDQRYFMCSGAILTLKHVITSASCLHYADIYEHHVDADLAVLVGATSPRAYVIKVNRYEMHPDYDYDIDSSNYATNNVAILYLACSIVEQDVVVPSLPKGFNDDVAHMCCREGCDLITIVQNVNNRQTARILHARHLPAPTHDDEPPNYRQLSNGPFAASRRFNKPMFPNDSSPMTRRIRSPLKLAAAPIFFGKEPRSSSRSQNSAKPSTASTPKKKKKKKTKPAKPARRKSKPRDRKRKKLSKHKHLTNGRRTFVAQIPILRALQQEGVNVEEQLAAVDWEKIEETMSKKFNDSSREKMKIFAKSVVDETMRRIETVVGDGGPGGPGGGKFGGRGPGNGSMIFGKLMPDSRNQSIDNFVQVFTKVVSSLVPPNSLSGISVSSDSSVEEKDLKDPPPWNEECPPLGSPIFIGDLLIGLLAYTCDDVQSWVEWQYVNVAKNMHWIRNRISAEYEPSVTCGETEKSPPLHPSPPQQQQQQESRSFPDASRTIGMTRKKFYEENSTEIRRDRRLEWSPREILNERRRLEAIGNFDDARIFGTEASPRILNDPWYARNSRLAPRHRSPSDDSFTDSLNRPRTFVPDTPVYNVNTCYVRADGTTDCQTGKEFNIR